MPNFSEMEIGMTFFAWGILLAISSIFLATRFERKSNILYLDDRVYRFCCLPTAYGNQCRPTLTSGCCVDCRWFFPRNNQHLDDNDCDGNSWIKRNIASSTYSFVRFLAAHSPFVAGLIGAKFGGNYTFYFASAMVSSVSF